MQSFIVKKSGKRVDAYLCEVIDELSRRQARLACENSLVILNGKPIKKPGFTLTEGDELQVDLANILVSARDNLSKSELPDVEVVFEHEDFLVLNKPREVHSVTLKPNDPATLADWLATNHPETKDASDDPREAGLIQRLDYYTCGLIIAARNKESWRELRELINAEKINKSYLCLVEGSPSSGEILEKLSANSIKFSKVKLSVPKASRHYVRKYFSEQGNPLIGDSEYGAKHSLKDIGINKEGFYLLAQSLEFFYKEHIKLEVGTDTL